MKAGCLIAWAVTITALGGACLAGECLEAGDSKYLHPSHHVVMPAWRQLNDECKKIAREEPGFDDYQEVESQRGDLREETVAADMLQAKVALCRSLVDMQDGLDLNESLTLNRAMDALLKTAHRIEEGYDYAITAIFLLALVHSEFGNDLTALRWYDNYLEAAPEGPYRDDCLLGIGAIHFRAGEFHLAARRLLPLAGEDCLARDRACFLTATYLLAWSNARLGNKSEAVFFFEKIVDALHGGDWLAGEDSLLACAVKTAAFRDMELLYGTRPRPRPKLRLAGRQGDPEKRAESAREIEAIYE